MLISGNSISMSGISTSGNVLSISTSGTSTSGTITSGSGGVIIIFGKSFTSLSITSSTTESPVPVPSSISVGSEGTIGAT